MKQKKLSFNLAVLLIISAFFASASTSDAAKLLEWKFDGNALDSSGNGFDGDIIEGGTDSVSFSDEGRGGCIELTNNKDRVLTSSYVDIGSTFTAAGWMKLPQDFGGAWNRFLTTSDAGTGFCITQGGNTENLKFTVNGNWAMPNAGQLTPGQWQHIAGTYDGSEANLYVNGELVAGPISMPVPSEPEQIIAMGRDQNSWETGFTGLFDEVKIYDNALSASEISDLYNAEYLQQVSDPRDKATLPAVDNSVDFEITIDKAETSTVTNVEWYKKIAAGDPNTPITSDGTKYNISLTQSGSTLTIYNPDANDEAYMYLAKVTLDSGSPSVIETAPASLEISDGLVHRWSFSGDLTDSAGSADGQLYDPSSSAASFVDGSQLLLDNPQVRPVDDPNNIAYVTLPDGIISSAGNFMTIEIWVTPHRVVEPSNWLAPIFAFGEDNDSDILNDSGGQGISGMLQTPESGPSVGVNMPNGNARWSDPAQAIEGSEFMLAMVWDGNKGEGRLYINGNLAAGPLNLPVNLSDINDVDNLIGHNWWSNGLINASFNEIRIYDWPYDAPWIQAHYNSGPDVIDVNPCMNPPETDLDGDCQITLNDFALLASEWLYCGRLGPCN
ncbi:LamG domain-containing protein [Sedimentisphaera salicampi]|uniref:LamG domain-containing protein n=1 Tax=Sedimentisphaera salicampi TaxID=1941349 RepID=UPI000B9CACFE|nr:LamG domain-containing protein [Sedimentisphaera salicampi]OXU16029.1 hypothetical protein SMSP1_00197 [Sedimentisphaera salicampi]